MEKRMMIAEDDVYLRMPHVNSRARWSVRRFVVGQRQPVLAPEVIGVEKCYPLGVHRLGSIIARGAKVATVYRHDGCTPVSPALGDLVRLTSRCVENKK